MRNRKVKVQAHDSREKAMLPKTERSIEILLNRSFNDMLTLLEIDSDITVKEVSSEDIKDLEFRSVMFTLSSSMFRIVLLLHFKADDESMDSIYQCLKFENSADVERQYRDYVCEMGNNLCGVACRMIGSAGSSTGMSTPVILENLNGTEYLRAQKPNFDTHIGGFNGTEPLFLASFCLFIDKGRGGELELDIPQSTVNKDEHIGELEFF